jgi:hypothetical protein
MMVTSFYIWAYAPKFTTGGRRYQSYIGSRRGQSSVFSKSIYRAVFISNYATASIEKHSGGISYVSGDFSFSKVGAKF